MFNHFTVKIQHNISTRGNMVDRQIKNYTFSILVVLLSLFVTFLPEITYSSLFFELLIQGRPYITLILLVIAVILLVKRRYFLGFVYTVCVLANIFWIVSSYSDSEQLKQCLNSANSHSIRVLSLNAYYKNQKYDEVVMAIESADADIVFLQEVQAGLYHASHKRLLIKYAFYYSEFEKGVEHGKALYSKYPIKDAAIKKLNGSNYRALHANIVINGVDINFIGIHSISPKNGKRANSRNRHIEALSRYIQGVSKGEQSIIIAGDFNTAPWHPVMRVFKEQTQLNNNDFYNIVGTWPVWLPTFLTIPIDHIFYSNNFGHSKYYRGLLSGSDHYPIYVDLEMCK